MAGRLVCANRVCGRTFDNFAFEIEDGVIEVIALQHSPLRQVGERARIVRAKPGQRAIAGGLRMNEDEVQSATWLD